jgi:hypothetical protein
VPLSGCFCAASKQRSKTNHLDHLASGRGPQVFTELHDNPGTLGPYVPWSQLAGKPTHRDLARSKAFLRSDQIECCALSPGKDEIAWGDPEACKFVNITAVNYIEPFVTVHSVSSAGRGRPSSGRPSCALPCT